MSEEKRLLQETQSGVRVITFNRPEARNAFDSEQYVLLSAALDAARDDAAVRAVVLTGSAGAFTAGADLREMGRLATTDEGGDGGEHPFASCMARVIDFDKPLLAAVNGVGVGLGFTILLHCDVVYIARGARLRVPFVSLGVAPEAASSYLLPLRVGYQNAAEILLTGDWVDSRRAVEIGLAQRECEPDALLPELMQLATRIAEGPLGSLLATKRLMKAPHLDAVRTARRREDAAFAERIGSPENLEAIRAFVEKRKPDFSKLG